MQAAACGERRSFGQPPRANPGGQAPRCRISIRAFCKHNVNGFFADPLLYGVQVGPKARGLVTKDRPALSPAGGLVRRGKRGFAQRGIVKAEHRHSFEEGEDVRRAR